MKDIGSPAAASAGPGMVAVVASLDEKVRVAVVLTVPVVKVIVAGPYVLAVVFDAKK